MSLNPQPVGNSQEQYEFFEVEDLAHSSQIKINHFRKNPGAVSHAPGFHFISFFKFSESQNCFSHGFLPHIIHCLLPQTVFHKELSPSYTQHPD